MPPIFFVLRGVGTLSTVSGGSIVGAHYYLEVKHLLENKADKEITREDYIDMVRRVQRDFLDGVQKNIRTRALADLRKNLKMVFTKDFGRSHRLGELYEEELYAKVRDNHPTGQPRTMKNLLIDPEGEATDFHPKFSNWRRRTKVPIALFLVTVYFPTVKWLFPEKATRGIAKKLLLACFGFIAAKIHLWKFDKMFLERGKLSRLLNLRQR